MVSLQVLGALVTHVGSGVTSEVQSALETMTLLASKFAQDLIPLSSHITGALFFLDSCAFSEVICFQDFMMSSLF